MINTEKLASQVNKCYALSNTQYVNVTAVAAAAKFSYVLCIQYRKLRVCSNARFGLLSLCLDHHKFSIKTNLLAFNSKRFTDWEKPRIAKIMTILIQLIGAEGALNEEFEEQRKKKEIWTTKEIAIDLQLMSTTLHCIYILYTVQLSLSLW